MRQTPKAIMLFAAGFGTRMKHLTADRPKPLVEVAGKPLIDHALALTSAVQPKTLVANLHYHHEMLADYLTPKGVAVSLEMPDILETGGGLRAALPLLGQGPVYTMNTDAIWQGPNPLAELHKAWDPGRMDALLICIPPKQAVGHVGKGDFILASDGKITRGAGMIYGGIQIIKTERLAEVKEAAFSLNVLWDQMLKEQRMFGLEFDGQWCDVGSPEGVVLAEAMLARGDV